MFFDSSGEANTEPDKQVDKAKSNGQNARQVMARIRAASGSGGNPIFPIGVEGLPPQDLPGYSMVGFGRIRGFVAQPVTGRALCSANAWRGLCFPGRVRGWHRPMGQDGWTVQQFHKDGAGWHHSGPTAGHSTDDGP